VTAVKCSDCGAYAAEDGMTIHSATCARFSWLNTTTGLPSFGGGILQGPGEQAASRALDSITELRERIERIEKVLDITEGES
jgi:O-acetyl-ADP-ribose deacetylase (regulator of RNase III)